MSDASEIEEQGLNKAAQIGLSSRLDEVENNENHQIVFTAHGTNITLANFTYGEGEEISPELTKALVRQTSEILNLNNFDLEGISLQIQQLEVQKTQLTLQAEADVEQIPFAEN